MGNDPANMIDPTGMLAGGAIDQGGGHTRNRFIANWSDYEYSNTEWGASWFDYYYNPAPVAGGGGSGFSNTSDDPAQGDGAPELGGGDQKGGSDASSGGVGLMAKYQAANDALDAMVYSSEIGSAAMGLVVAFNQNLNPLYAVIDGIHGVATGTDLLGQPVNKTLSAGGAILAAIPGVGYGKAVWRTAANTAREGAELFKFSAKAAQHMSNPGRAVPVQILEQAIKASKGVADPRGSRAMMHTVEMWKNGKAYNLQVLYDRKTNSIWHFQYSSIQP